MHSKSSPLAGKTVKIKPDARHPQDIHFGGSDFRVEDWWDKVSGSSWRNQASTNPACVIYMMRRSTEYLPDDDEVLYGHIGDFGYLVHLSEIVEDS